MSSFPTFLSIDVLSSGAEFSGTGLFLSVWRKSPFPTPSGADTSTTKCDNLMETSKLLCRYSLTGCACDVSSRGAADQRFSLSAVQAIFCTTNRLSELANLPGFLYALQRSCAIDTLSIVSLAPANIVQSLVELLHGRQLYPTVRVCQIPSSTASTKDDLPTWWQIYSDVHIVAHIALFSSSSTLPDKATSARGEDPALVYVFTVQADSKQPDIHHSLIYIPGTTPDTALPNLIDFFSNKSSCLPKECAAFRWTVCIRSPTSSSIAALPPDWLVFTTNSTSTDDVRLLRRARLQTKSLKERFGATWAAKMFPVRCHQRGDATASTMLLQTGTSIVFDRRPYATTTTPDLGILYSVYDRCPSFVTEAVSTNPETNGDESDNHSVLGPNAIPLDGLQRFCSVVDHDHIPKVDENEIDLEDEDNESIDLATPQAQLLVLGTGCASPSSLRGASGYALLLDSSAQTIVLEAGEGFCTQWNRHAPCSTFRSIQVIWISHAHWDHYGGLVNLLRCILDSAANDARESSFHAGGLKRRRVEQLSPPYVVAPTKVLRYLELVVSDVNGANYYRGVHSKASRRLAGMCDELNNGSADGKRRIASWNVVKVDHGCEAYGLVLELHKLVAKLNSNSSATFLFAFSGDTRPSTEFTRCCDLASRQQGCSSHVDLMVHEATFDEEEAQMSVTKKHSTVQEALDIASRAKTQRLVLTHFSQRYHRGCEVQDAPSGRTYPTQTLFAVDGMVIPMF